MELNEETELQYECSKWNTRYDPEQCVEKHRENITQASNRTKHSVPFKYGVRYGRRQGQVLDIFGQDHLPKGGAEIFVFVHGGYWQSFSRDISSYCVKPLYDNGIVTVIPDYDIAPNATMGIIIEEIKELAEFVLNMAAEYTCRGVWFGGHSAGAHLVAVLLQNDWTSALTTDIKDLFKGVVLVSGVYDLKPILETSINNALRMTSTDVQKYSPMYRKVNINPSVKIIIAVAENDSKEFHRQSKEFAEVLNECGNDTKCFTITNEDHFTIVEKLQDSGYYLTKLYFIMFHSDNYQECKNEKKVLKYLKEIKSKHLLNTLRKYATNLSLILPIKTIFNLNDIHSIKEKAKLYLKVC